MEDQPPSVAKNLCCASRFCTGSGGAVVQGHNLRFLGARHQPLSGPENQDSQAESAHAESAQGVSP